MSEKIVVTIDADLEEIIPTFLDNRHKDLVKIDQALASKDLKAIESIAHKLAGNAGSYGLDQLGELGASLESSCQEGDKDKVDKLCQEYKDYLSRLEIKFE
jgi:hypothetical protein